MKLQVITTAAVLTAFFSTTSADAGKFNLGKALRTAQQVQRTVNNINNGGGQPKYKTLPYNPPQKGGHPGHGHKPVCKPKPHPGHGHKPCPPVNRPPKKCYTLKLINNAGAEVYYTLNQAEDYRTMPVDDVDWIKTLNPAPHTISYHNGQEVVEYELDADGTYGFEWQGETLQLLEIQG
jgi:hypothetical protein